MLLLLEDFFLLPITKSFYGAFSVSRDVLAIFRSSLFVCKAARFFRFSESSSVEIVECSKKALF